MDSTMMRYLSIVRLVALRLSSNPNFEFEVSNVEDAPDLSDDTVRNTH